MFGLAGLPAGSRTRPCPTSPPPPSPRACLPQVLLKCRALELLVEGCLERGSAAADAPALAHLLAAVAHPSTPAAVTQALAQAVAALGQVCGTDRLAPTPAAKRAAAAALGLVRRGVLKPPPAKPAEAPAAKLKRLGGELVRQEARLAGTTQPKELCKAYGAVLELLCGQLDVLGPVGGAGAPPQAPEVAAALQPLEELRAALATRLQVGWLRPLRPPTLAARSVPLWLHWKAAHAAWV